MPADTTMTRLVAADPARGFEPDRLAAEALLERVLLSPSAPDRRPGRRVPRRRRAFALTLTGLFALALAAAALAAVGVIRFGSPAPPSGVLGNPSLGIGALTPGTARVLPVATADPAGGLPWGMRVFSTNRGVGCLEVGHLLDGKLGVLGRDGAFGNDGAFHVLPAGGFSNGGQCDNLDAHGRLFYTVDSYGIPVSGWTRKGSCLEPPPPGLRAPGVYRYRPPTGWCPLAELRDLHYGLLGPDATRVTYRIGGRVHTLTPVGPEGAYLIVGLQSDSLATIDGRRLLGGAATGIVPLPVGGPIISIAYRNGFVCRIAATRPGATCAPPGYTAAPAPVVTRAQVATPLHVHLVGSRGHWNIKVSFTARVGVTRASSSYELLEDASSPSATFVATQRDIRVGQTISWLVRAPRPGVYRGKVVLGQGGSPPYPGYGYSPGPLVGRFRIRVP
jgi:hypothetical protein